MIKIDRTIDTDVLTAIQQTGRLQTLMNTNYRRTVLPEARRLEKQLQVEPGSPHYPLRWKSERQRRYVLAKLREENNLPYTRTHAYSQGWSVTVEPLTDGGDIIIHNPSPAAEFIGGDFAQPFHLDTGWPQAAPLVMAFQERVTDQVIEGWHTVVDEFAGVRG